MKYRFKAEDWQKMSASEKMKRCFLMAEEAQALADDVAPGLSRSYHRIADAWLQLAGDIERASTEVN
jgi:hypothetical protein